MRGLPSPLPPLPAEHMVHMPLGCRWSAWWVLWQGAVVVCRGCAGALLAAVLPHSSELRGPCCVGVHCGGSYAGVCSCGVLGLWLRWLVGHLGAATSRGGAGLFVLVVIVRWAVLSC
jgi:hypothetical protein